MRVHNCFMVIATPSVTIRRFKSVLGISGVHMGEVIVESSVKAVVDLNEKIRVLHVDDDAGLLKITKQCLEMEAPVQVDTANSVEEALTKLEKEKYDVVVSDYQMPIKNGLEFLGELREKGNTIPFIMFTGKGREEVAIKALNLGANQYLNKVGETETVYTELAHSITELAKTRKAEEKQCESEEKFRDLFEKANDGLIFVDMSGRIVDINQKAVEIAEKRKEDVIGKSFLDLGLVSSKNLSVLVEKLKQQATGKSIGRFELEIEKENGEKRIIETNSTVIQKNNRPTGSLAIVRDITERRHMEEELRQSEQKLRSVVYGSPIPAFVIGKDHKIIYWNLPLEKLSGLKAEDMVGTDKQWKAFYPKKRPNMADLVLDGNIEQIPVLYSGKWKKSEFVEGGYEATDFFPSIGKNGAWLYFTAVAVRDSQGSLIGALEMLEDITERKRFEEALKENEERLKTIVMNAPIGIATSGVDAHFLSANDTFCKILGYTQDELQKLTFKDITHPEDIEASTAKMKELGAGRISFFSQEKRYIKKDGNIIVGRVMVSALRDQEDKPRIFIVELEDITERKKTEKALQDAKDYAERLVHTANAIVVGLDAQGNVQTLNATGEEITGYTQKELKGRNWFEVIVPRDRYPHVWTEFNRLMSGGPPKEFENPILTKNGEERYIVWRNNELQHNQSQIIGTISFGLDITERKKMEDALRNSEERLRAIVSSSPNPIIVLDLNGNFVELNEAAMKQAGFPKKEDILGKSGFNYVAPRDRTRAMELVKKALTEGGVRRADISLQTVEGHERNAELSASVVRDAHGTPAYTVVAIMDVTERKKAEEAVKESEAKYRILVEQSQQGIAIVQGFPLRLVFANSAMATITGYSIDELTSLSPKQMEDLIHPDDRASFFKRLGDRLQRKSASPHYEFRGIRKDGSVLFMELSSSNVEYNGRPAVQAAFVDMTYRKKAEEALRESEERYSRLSAATFEGIGVSEHGKVTDANDQLAKMLGYEPGELVGKNVLDIVAPESRDLVKANMQKGIEGPYEHLAIRKDGSVFPVEIRARLIHHRGQTERVSAIRDITESKKLEKSLRENEEKFAGLFRGNPEATVFTDSNMNIVEVNPRFVALFGYRQDEVRGKRLNDVVVPENLVEEGERLNQRTMEGFVYHDTVRKRKDGSLIPVSVSAAQISVQGQLIGSIGVYKDISQQKEAFAKFRGLFTGNPEAAAYLGPDFHVLDVNSRFEELFGYSLAEIKGKHINEVIVPCQMLEEGRMLDQRAGKGYVYYDTARKRKDGSLVPVSVSAAAIVAEGNLIGHVAMYKDISQQKTVEESLKESEERFKALFAGGPEASVYLSPDFRIQNVNHRFEQLFGYSLAEIEGKRLDDVIVQEGKQEEAAMLNGKAVGGYVYHDTLRKRKDGSLVPVSISAAPIVINGQLSGTVGTYKDISDLRSAEQKLAVMNEKLRVVGGLTRHDIRNKLSIVTANTYLMEKKLKDHPEVKNGFEELKFACETIVKLLEFARDYESLGVEELTYVDLEESIEKAVSLFTNTEQTKIANKCHGLTVLADSLLSKLFYNLIDNSLKHGSHVTHIRMSCEESLEELRLVYEDDGVGITQETKAKLFSEGYTTGKGSGYGLYLIRKMMEAYGWSINEAGSPGKGARFIIAIPKLNKQGKENYRIAAHD